MVALRRFRATGPSFADLVPYAGLVDNGVLLLKDGSLMAGWYFAGPDAESATDLEHNELSRQINVILSRLGTGWMIQVVLGRQDHAGYRRHREHDLFQRRLLHPQREGSAWREIASPGHGTGQGVRADLTLSGVWF